MTKEKESLTLTLEVVESDDGGFVGYIKELPGCATQGDTMEELHQNLEDLVPAWIQAIVKGLRDEQPVEPIGKVVSRETIRVRPPELVHA